MDEIRERLDKLTEEMKNNPHINGEKRILKKPRRGKKKNRVVAATPNHVYTSNTASAVEATSKTEPPTHHTVTLTVRSRHPSGHNSVAVGHDNGFDKNAESNSLVSGASYVNDHSCTDDDNEFIIHDHTQNAGSDVCTENDITMSDSWREKFLAKREGAREECHHIQLRENSKDNLYTL